MSLSTIRIGILKFGCIGASPLLEMIIDERADREDVKTIVMGTGPSMDPDFCEEVTKKMIEEMPHFVIMVSPNAALKGPKIARELLEEADVTALTISDSPAAKAFYKKDNQGKKVPVAPDKQGFVIITADSMIGARREFLDPTEMVLYNSDVLKVLAASGVIRALQKIIDGIVNGIKKGPVKMPLKKITEQVVIEYGGYHNPYAEAKAYAAYKIAEQVSSITSVACFKKSDATEYIPMVAAGHEMMRTAALLADQAREMEKTEDTVLRTSHKPDGKISERRELRK